MRLRVLLPTRILLDERVTRVSAEAENGSFTLLPRHIDFVTALKPGLLTFVPENGREVYVAVDRAILVKREKDVFVSTPRAVKGEDLESLQRTIEEEFEWLSEHEKKARSALVGLEMSMIRRFLELGERR
jgi:F-type H+-transporting ATPase subunit epsilon